MRTLLSEAELDSLTECECGHYLNEHSSEGCLATDEDGLDGICVCMSGPDVIRVRAFEAILTAHVAAAEAWVKKIEALHAPFYVCDDCDHDHTDADVREGRAFDTGYSYTCKDALLYIACQSCCVTDDEQTEECATYHDHPTDGSKPRCATVALIAEARS